MDRIRKLHTALSRRCGGYLDRLLLAFLNISAAVVSYQYTDDILPLHTLFTHFHAFSAIALLLSCRFRSITPVAMALSSGTFVGRALAIWLAIPLDASPFPTATQVLAGVQWTVLAWVIRPSALHSSDLARVAEDLGIKREEL